MIKTPRVGVGEGSGGSVRPIVRPQPVDVLSGGLPNMTGGGGVRSILGTMHEGGKVKKDGAYELEAGETVTPAKKEKGAKAEEANSEGRNSEYRKVYLNRKNKK